MVWAHRIHHTCWKWSVSWWVEFDLSPFLLHLLSKKLLFSDGAAGLLSQWQTAYLHKFISSSPPLTHLHRGVMQRMDDLWPGVAAVCLCPVCVTSAMARGGGNIINVFFKARWGKRDGRGPADAAAGRPNYWPPPLHFARAGSSCEHRDNDDSSSLAVLLSPSLSKPRV